jgi:cytochrome P450
LVDIDVPDDIDELSRANDVLMEDFSYRFESALPIPFWLPSPWNLRVRRAIRQMDAIIHAIIRQRRESSAGRTDLLSLLLQARDEGNGSGMTDRQLRDEVLTLLLAGHETTANALAWTGYLLTQHPEVESRLLEELQQVLGDRRATAADLPRLVYTDWVVRESMRLYPPVYAFGRRALEACEIGGHAIPRGTTVILAQWVVHRDSRYFDHPDEFLPERWQNNLAARLPKYAYFPFGGGPRICIGNTFAQMEAVLVLATLVRRFRWTLVPGQTIKPWPSVTLRPAEGIKIVCTTRSGKGA